MPKDMFYNISEAKRTMFLRVAVEEFTSKPFAEVSVNTIIKKAQISRGSFYTYFENLEALFNHLFRKVRADRQLYAKQLLKESNRDYFTFMRRLFAHDFDAYSKKGTYTLFRNYINYIQTTKKASLRNVLIKDSFMDSDVDISQIFDFTNLNLTEDEFFDLVEVVVILMVNTFIKSENQQLTKEDIISLFNKRMNLLEYGVRKD